ncbi:hypothetical protein G6F50_014952 [Rhizopus delemar]|uniref:Uncharacterized protein n=1 Tax=Rhizopus delemar TaxID=936053 RepID=A0A9P6Y220_9FUNG|nr:hypothetical protein G6F50_014952 [Rhizopus delemar]
MIAPENQTRMANRMQARKVITLDASHASLASRAAEVAGLIDEAAQACASLALGREGLPSLPERIRGRTPLSVLSFL